MRDSIIAFRTLKLIIELCVAVSGVTSGNSFGQSSGLKQRCQTVLQRELVRKSWRFIIFYFYMPSREYPRALSSSI
jgi:hypothetical protein